MKTFPSQNQPTKVVVGASLADSNASVVDEFRYDPDGQRFTKKATWKEGSATRYEHTYYLGNTEYTTFGPGSGPAGVLGRYRIRIGTTAVRIIDVLTSGTTATTEYLHRDHLGSVEAVTDQNGNSLIIQAFEPFGQRKDSDWASNIHSSELQALLDAKKSRGYTGHEHMDRTGLIHMNGRVYDPQLGRFLSPDPIVQAPGNSQSWNRYTYVFNNPLRFIDPDGFEGKEPLEEIIRNERDGQLNKYEQSRREVFEEMVITGKRITKNTLSFGEKFLLDRMIEELSISDNLRRELADSFRSYVDGDDEDPCAHEDRPIFDFKWLTGLFASVGGQFGRFAQARGSLNVAKVYLDTNLDAVLVQQGAQVDLGLFGASVHPGVMREGRNHPELVNADFEGYFFESATPSFLNARRDDFTFGTEQGALIFGAKVEVNGSEILRRIQNFFNDCDN